MRLTGYINETYKAIEDIDNLNARIQKDCKPYLKLIRQSKEPMYRGMLNKGEMGIMDVRQDRRPMQMDYHAAKYLNDWLAKEGHARRDKSVLCSPGTDLLKIFGKPFYIFPIGKVKYTFIESEDINFTNTKTGWQGDMANCFWVFRDQQFRHNNYTYCERQMTSIRKPFKDYFHSKDFMYGYRQKWEFWFECKQFYFCKMGDYVWDDKYEQLI